MISPSAVSAPRIHSALLSYETRSWVCFDRAQPDIEAPCEGLTEYTAQLDGSIRLRCPQWRVVVRPALQSLQLA